MNKLTRRWPCRTYRINGEVVVLIVTKPLPKGWKLAAFSAPNKHNRWNLLIEKVRKG